jgi:CheY-like chemotaxis protein
MAVSRVLVVEDSQLFRQIICSKLKERPEFEIVGEVADGLEAVQKAQELQPDLIILDIGLPSLNGIDAARRIRTLSPRSKILFLSQESSADVVQEALATGALGYVVKTQAENDLLPAIEAVLQGIRFVGSGLSGPHFTPALEKVGSTRNHEVEYYSNDTAFVVGFARSIKTALDSGRVVMVAVTESHRRSLFQRLLELETDIVSAIEQRRYISLDAELLSMFMVKDQPDRARSLEVVGNVVLEAATASRSERRRVQLCGECSACLVSQGKAEAAVVFEHLWDMIAKSCNVDILCGYMMKNFEHENERHIYERICAEHSAVSHV